MGTGGARGREPGALGSTSWCHAGCAGVCPVGTGTSPVKSSGAQTEASPGTPGCGARLGLALRPDSGRCSLSSSEPQFPHWDLGTTTPTTGERLWEGHEEAEVKVGRELQVSVAMAVEPACWGPVCREDYFPLQPF